jgi:hypothetical protein
MAMLIAASVACFLLGASLGDALRIDTLMQQVDCFQKIELNGSVYKVELVKGRSNRMEE